MLEVIQLLRKIENRLRRRFLELEFFRIVVGGFLYNTVPERFDRDRKHTPD